MLLNCQSEKVKVGAVLSLFQRRSEGIWLFCFCMSVG